MANYLYIFRGGRTNWASSPKQMQESMQKWGDWIQQLTKSGNFKAGDPLGSEGKVIKGTKKIVTDGPYAEAKDVVGGYLLISAGSLNEAVELSRGCPVFENDGSVEVRPIQQM